MPGPSVAKESISRLLRGLAGGLLLGGLAASPLAYGTTAWWSEHLLAEALLAAFVLWALSGVLTRGFAPRLDWVDFSLLYLLAVGWWMTLNAHGVYDFEFRDFFPLAEPAAWTPGSVDRLGSYSDMVRVTGLCAAFVVARSLGENPAWRHRLLATAALTGLFIAVAGVILKLGGPSLMAQFWPSEKISETDFAFFRYHANAGAYLNLTWPIALGMGLGGQTLGRCNPVLSRRLWLGVALVILIAVQLNLSRGAIALSVILGVSAGVAWIMRAPTANKKRSLIGLTGFLASCLGLAAFLSWFSYYPTAWHKWETLPENRQTSITYRWELQQIALRMARDAGWWGFGPGTFEAAFAGYQDSAGKPPGRFDEAHDDYLQTLIEWGLGGTIAWAWLVVGGLVKIRRRVAAGARQTAGATPFWTWYALLLALLGVLLHATFDFPLEIDSIRLAVLVFLALGWSREAGIPAGFHGSPQDFTHRPTAAETRPKPGRP